jgi:hypothetical protein
MKKTKKKEKKHAGNGKKCENRKKNHNMWGKYCSFLHMFPHMF